MKTGDSKKKHMDRDQILCILSFAGVMILIGIPTWWKCTKVYRVDLPYEQIQTELHTPDVLPAKIILVSEDIPSDKHTFPIALRNALMEDKVKPAAFKIEFSARGPSSFESEVMKDFSIQDSDNKIVSRQSNVNEGTILIYSVPSLSGLILLGTGRSLYVGPDVEASQVGHVVREVVLGDSVLKSSAESIESDKKLLDNKLNLRRVPASAEGYDILFTLLNPEPEKLNAEWDIREAVESYVEPFIGSISNLSTFKVKSQVSLVLLFFFLRSYLKQYS
uniref:GPI transamidase component PIG-S n=1 Tax=Caligus rogercresseyi TaxID=217165 RepID=C1BPT8_CALRO|nr:GPI transamidase component PIG-S [Caligus rogercresseyi]